MRANEEGAPAVTEARSQRGQAQAFEEAKAAERRLIWGQVALVIEKSDGVVIGHRVEMENLASADLNRLMRKCLAGGGS
jgi:hypothetical protein